MKSFDCNTRTLIETPEKLLKFVDEIEQVCKKYDLSISHEDGHGAFEIENFDEDNIDWLRNAHVNWK